MRHMHKHVECPMISSYSSCHVYHKDCPRKSPAPCAWPWGALADHLVVAENRIYPQLWSFNNRENGVFNHQMWGYLIDKPK